MADSLLLRFAQEELVYLLRALKITSLPGLEPEPLKMLDEDHQALALAVTDRTLRARGVLSWDNKEKRHVDPIVAGILQDCAHPTYTLLVDIFRADKLNLRYLYSFSKRAAIEHCVPEPGIHQFMLATVPADISEHLFNILTVEEMLQDSGKAQRFSQEQGDNDDTGTSTDPASTTHTLTHLPDNDAMTIRVLTTQLPSETGNGLASSIKNPKVTHHLALWDEMPNETDNREPRATLTVIQGDSGLFLMVKEDLDTTHLDVFPATIPQVNEYIEYLIRPALKVLQSMQR